MAKAGKKKHLAKATPVAGPKTPKTQPSLLDSGQAKKPLFSFVYADTECQNEWAFKPSGSDAQDLLTFFASIGTNTWSEIANQKTGGKDGKTVSKHHTQPVETIDKAAQKDLEGAKLDTIFGGEEMFRFRLGGTKRLWGFRRNRIFYAVWWDPNHKVYPVD